MYFKTAGSVSGDVHSIWLAIKEIKKEKLTLEG